MVKFSSYNSGYYMHMRQIRKNKNMTITDHMFPKVSLGSDPKSMARKPSDVAKLLGQVFTPQDIAEVMIQELFVDVIGSGFKLLDPCVGPATFPSIVFKYKKIGGKVQIVAFDIDPKMISISMAKVSKRNNSIDFIHADYLQTKLTNIFDRCIMNPPYIRQEWIENKSELRRLFQKEYNVDIPGTSNLYVFFVVKAIQDLKPGGRFAFILYDSWQSTRYGEWLSSYIQQNCNEVKLQAVRSQPFLSRLIDATIIYGRKRTNTICKQEMSFCFSSEEAGPFRGEKNFVELDEVFTIKRGLRLKQKDFFLCDYNKYKSIGATQFVKKIYRIAGYAISRQHPEAALLVTSSLSSKKVIMQIMRRLEEVMRNPEKNTSILTWYNERHDTWYMHRNPPRARILFNYYLRNKPKHIYNPNIPYSDNFYGIAPMKISALACLAILNSTAVSVGILANARNQGNGLSKIQLYKYKKVLVPDIREMSQDAIAKLDALGGLLIKDSKRAEFIIGKVDSILQKFTKSELLRKEELDRLLTKYDKSARKPRII